jgi:hypothetical protein
MIYGSSPYTQRKIIGITGPTGTTGPTGSDGNTGNPGATGNTGNTGGSIIGITLSNNTLITTFSDDTSFVGSNIKGETGNYYIFVGAASVGGGQLSIVSGVCYDIFPNGNILPSVKIRGLTTASAREGSAVVSINADIGSNVVGITYNLNNIKYLGISGGTNHQLVVYKSGTEFYGLTGTNYDTVNETVDLQVMNYGERVHFVEPVKKTIYDPGTGAATAGRYFYWPIDWEKGNIFVLNSYTGDVIGGERVDGQILLVRNPPSSDIAKGITVIIPSGITSSNSVYTQYAVTDNLTEGVTFDTGNYSISWPLTYPPCLTTGTDVINMISLDNIWYANFGVYNDGISQVDWNADYSNCLESINLDDYQYVPPDNGGGSEGGGGNQPICTDPNVTGLCCIACNSGDSFVTTCSNCIPYIQQGIAQFFPGFGDGYAGCTAENASRGVCCYRDVNGNIVKDTDPAGVRLCDCTRLASDYAGPAWFRWNQFSDCIPNLEAINCQSSFDGYGACCDGFGSCSNELQASCESSGRYWQGLGKECTYSNGFDTVSPCTGGTGGCCDGGICTDNTGAQACLTSGGKFHGCGISCSVYECSVAYRGCCASAVDPFVVEQHWQGASPLPDNWAYETNGVVAGTGTITHQLKVGDEFAGGIVAGIFKPKGTKCFGNTAFGGYPPENIPPTNDDSAQSIALFNSLNNGAEKACDYYFSQYDPSGYGFTLNNGHNGEEDAWLLIVSKFPVIIEQRYCNNQTNPANGIHTAYIAPTLFNVTPSIPTTTNYENGTTTQINDSGNNYRVIYSKNFRLTHGGTAFSSISLDDFASTTTALSETTRPNYSLCDTNHPGSNVVHDGVYGTTPGATYWANISAFNDCSDTPYTCNECADYPFVRSRRGWGSTKAGMNGNFSRNWGLFNTIRIINSDISELYLYSANGLFPSNNKLNYGGKPYISSTDPGFTGFFQPQTITTPERNTAYQQTTAGEGCSIWNRYYYPSDLPPTTTDEQNFTIPTAQNRQYVPSTGAETEYNAGFGNNGWMGTLYPQLSRWYIPSIDELAFVANACVDPTINLQQKIEDNQGIRIGNTSLNSATNNPAGPGLTGWVWSSTITFNEGVTQQYLQGITASSPQPLSGTNVTVDGNTQNYSASQLTCNQFSKAWSIKFDTGTSSALPNPDGFKVMKRNDSKSLNDNINNRFELRLVRQIRCDRRFYWNGDNSRYRNTFWAVPRLTPSDVVTATPFAHAGSNTVLPGFLAALPTSTNLAPYINDLNTFIGTIHKNSMRTS